MDSKPRAKRARRRVAALEGRSEQRASEEHWKTSYPAAELLSQARKLTGLIEDKIGVCVQAWTPRYVAVSRLLTDPSLTKAQRRLIAVRRAQPLR